jgi:CheY-like chemotaxis protein
MSGNARLAPTILLAEDVHSSGFRKLPRNLFREWGFCVLEAAHGLEAWHQARKCEGRIDILIAEQNLPFMDGWELAAHVRKLFPSVKVLLILQGTAPFYRVSPSLAVLHEPVEYSLLMNKLHSLLGTGFAWQSVDSRTAGKGFARG